jgi:hypothetical protein
MFATGTSDDNHKTDSAMENTAYNLYNFVEAYGRVYGG